MYVLQLTRVAQRKVGCKLKRGFKFLYLTVEHTKLHPYIDLEIYKMSKFYIHIRLQTTCIFNPLLCHQSIVKDVLVKNV